MKRIKSGVTFVGVGLALAVSSASFAQQPLSVGGMPQSQSTAADRPIVTNPTEATQHSTVRVNDKQFLKDAAQGGMTEVELAKLANQKASRNDTKQFAQMMIDDHTKANNQIKRLAQEEHIPISSTLDAKHRSRLEKLSKLSADSFDNAYIKDQLKDHVADVQDFANEAQNGSEQNVKNFAQDTLPTLQQHLDAIKLLDKAAEKSK